MSTGDWLACAALAGASLAAFGGFAFLVTGAQPAVVPGVLRDGRALAEFQLHALEDESWRTLLARAPELKRNGHSLAAFRFRSVLDDSWHSLSEYRGKVVLLNVWATWCAPCRGEVPGLERIQRELGRQGVVVFMVSSEDPDSIRKFLARSPTQTEQGYVSATNEGPNVAGVEGRPINCIVDRQGILREVLLGSVDSGDLADLVHKYL